MRVTTPEVTGPAESLADLSAEVRAFRGALAPAAASLGAPSRTRARASAAGTVTNRRAMLRHRKNGAAASPGGMLRRSAVPQRTRASPSSPQRALSASLVGRTAGRGESWPTHRGHRRGSSPVRRTSTLSEHRWRQGQPNSPPRRPRKPSPRFAHAHLFAGADRKSENRRTGHFVAGGETHARTLAEGSGNSPSRNLSAVSGVGAYPVEPQNRTRGGAQPDLLSRLM